MLKTLGRGSGSHPITRCTNKAKPLPSCSSPLTSGHSLTPLLCSPASPQESDHGSVPQKEPRDQTWLQHGLSCTRDSAEALARVCTRRKGVHLCPVPEGLVALGPDQNPGFARWTGLLYLIEKTSPAHYFSFSVFLNTQYIHLRVMMGDMV